MSVEKRYSLLLLLLSIFCTVHVTHAFFTSSSNIKNDFNTKNYKFSINANGGTFSSNNSIIVSKGTTVLPSPNRVGYNFIGYSTNSNGNVIYSNNINNILDLQNKEIYAKWDTIKYSISYNLNGGSINNQKTSYTVEDTFDLVIPSKTGYSFLGWTGSNGNTIQKIVTIPKGTTGNLSYSANWDTNSYLVDVNPKIDGTTYNSGLNGYTFDVWINGNLVADDVIDWCQNVSYGSKVRVKANNVTGRSTNYDQTFTVGTNSIDINPSWTTNTYESHFYLDGVHRLTTYNKYGAYISTPNTSASALGYDSNFYYVSGFTPWTTWYQPDYAVGFTINISEYNCMASFGSAGSNNANYQLNKLQAAGYDFCVVNSGWGALECSGNYSKVINLYNNAWNILPRSGNGYSIYKQISCDSGWSNYQRR